MRIANSSLGAAALALVLGTTGSVPAAHGQPHEPMSAATAPARAHDHAGDGCLSATQRKRHCAGVPRAGAGSGTVTIDILAAFTSKAAAEAGGEGRVRSRIRQAVSSASQAFATSAVHARLRLVGITRVRVPARLDLTGDGLLTAVARRGDGVADGLPRLREQYGADLVTVVTGSQGASGLASRPRRVTSRTSGYSYSLVAQNGLARHSLAHEIAHNLGAQHDHVTAPRGGATARGHFPRSGAWSTIEAYESSCRRATGGRCTRINRFSNPRQTYGGERLGTPVWEARPADTVRVFNAVVRIVAGYRERPHRARH
ncbi:M12 family metallo-peptidase [Streptomyces sp. SP18CS02]|uniref:M12 family metallo-peptidase n=1 Tax=Streptomyces sp. SP18CS02 TaxID=3002531 RepID=UPI002E75A2A5|nr:M12 family metallo-peptidase [Streptomyces sp. SP18CS02]MEE1757418.1 M12 family metallo-peptidase [Streptomyces sp. SP18CS02]